MAVLSPKFQQEAPIKSTYTMNFTSPMTAGIEYVSAANSTDLLNTDAEYVVNSEVDKTITVLNPNNQLLIDTNYDGIYETGITEHLLSKYDLDSTAARH